MKEVFKTTCPRDCYDSCGIAVIKRDGAVRKVLGDPEHPVSRGALCGKCALAYNGVWRDPEARLTAPLLRDGPKGSGRFKAIGWEEALKEVAQALRRQAEAGTPEKVLQTHYTGTCSMLAGSFPQRFFNRYGATEVDPDSICNKAGHVALEAFSTELFGHGLRSEDHSRQPLRHGLGRQPLGLRTPCPQALAGGDRGQAHRRRSGTTRHRRDGGPSSAALSRAAMPRWLSPCSMSSSARA